MFRSTSYVIRCQINLSNDILSIMVRLLPPIINSWVKFEFRYY